MLGEQGPVPARVRDEQDHDGHITVPLLEFRASLERLDIVESHLGLDADPSTLHLAHRVPRSAIRRDRERHLGHPRRAGREAGSEPLEQPPGGQRLVQDRRSDRRVLRTPGRPLRTRERAAAR